MIAPGHPHFRPAKPGLSPLVIVLLVVGAVFVMGAGSCALLGGLVLIGASAEPDPAAGQQGSSGASQPATGAPGATGAPTSTAAATATEDDEPPPAPSEPDPTTATAPATTTAKPAAAASGSWSCTASGSVRVCGFAGVCNNQMVFGNAFGSDRFLASMQAKNACEGMARAKGGATVCIVQCTVR